jgi:8-oxo-dGTP pyrophosphatase MutT (NUDIX family)
MNPSHIVVATVVQRDGHFLFVEEQIAGATVLNQPAGHWEEGETLFEAAVRETLEETGWEVGLTAFLGLYEFKPVELDYGFLRVAFLAKPLHHHPERPLDTGIERAVWLTPDQLRTDAARHRSPMVQACVDDALAGRDFPLAIVQHLV